MPTLPGRRTNETARAALTTAAAALKRATAAIAGQLIRGTAVAASAADAAAADQHWGVLPPGRLATAAGSHKSPNAETAAATASLPTAAAAAAHGGLQQCAAAIGRAVADNGICCSRPATNANHAYGPYFSIFNLCGDESTEHAATATLRWVDELACIAAVISAHHVKLHGQHDQGRSN